MTRRALLILVMLSTAPFTATHAQTPSNVQIEIDYLLQYVETSGCSFYRNGSWYDGSHAKAHLRTKYDYLAARKLIGSAEDFIDKAATKSSMSGKPYKIRCGSGEEVESGQWFHQVLVRYRAGLTAPTSQVKPSGLGQAS
jgi:hypothetical protein